MRVCLPARLLAHSSVELDAEERTQIDQFSKGYPSTSGRF